MTELGEHDDRRSRRRIWRSGLYVGLLAAGVLAALQIHRFWQRRGQPSDAAASFYEPDPVATSQPAGRVPLADLVAAPTARAGLKFLSKDPGGPQPPEGATFRYAIQRVQDGCLQRHLKYRYAGRIDAAAEHYRRTLTARGLELLKDASPEGKRKNRVLIFQSDREQITVRLGKRLPKTDTTPISVTVLRLAQ